MRKSVIALSIAGAFVTAAQPQMAQQAPAPGAGGADQMPFDVPYGESITLAKADEGHGGRRSPRRRSHRATGSSPIAVVDPSGDLVHFSKMDQTQVAFGRDRDRTRRARRRASAGRRRSFAAAMGGAGRRVRADARRPRSRRAAASRWSRAARSSARSAAAARPDRRMASPARPGPRRSSRPAPIRQGRRALPRPSPVRQRSQSRP